MSRRALFAAALFAGLLATVACGGDDTDPGDDPDFVQPSGDTTIPGTRATSVTSAQEGIVRGSDPSIFSIVEDDLGNGHTTDSDHTFSRGAGDYQAFGFFDTPDEAKEKLAEWGYQGGYITGFNPTGLTAGVLRGEFYIDVELHLFDTIDHARTAFEHFVLTRAKADGAEYLDGLDANGNEWAALKLVSGKVTNSDIDAVYHTYIFRRGNMVAVVQTRGAAPYMKDEYVEQLASIIDEKVLGTRGAVQPTPPGGIIVPPTPTPAP
ncbi:MAG TPA: hypothetical protein VFK32_04770 [Tepidiformaceae bacterium]|nr:hypothetical protein [Tepidiformaceae bacterium]